MKPGDRVFVDGVGAGHVIAIERTEGRVRPRIRPRAFVRVRLDTGRVDTYGAEYVRPTT